MRNFLLTWLLAAGFPAQAVKVEGPLPAKRGETCIVCNTAVEEDGDAFLVDGQRVAVMRAMREEFLLHPLLYANRLRPQGMVSSSSQPETLPAAYLWAGVFVLAGLLSGGACAHMALGKGLSSARWFFLGFFFSVPACLALATQQAAENAPAGLAKIPSTRSSTACPGCGAGNHPASRRCAGCGAALQPTAPSEVRAAQEGQ